MKDSLERYNNYINKYKMLGKRPPISMVVDSNDNIWAYEFCIPDIECKRHTIIIPDFVYGFASIQDIGKAIDTGKVDTNNKQHEYIDFLKNIHKIKSEIQYKQDSSVISSGFGIEELIIDGGNKEFTGTLQFIFSDIHQKKLVIQNFLGKDITDMSQTFTSCECEEIDIQGMKLGTIKDADMAFADCENLKSLDLSNIEFDSQASMDGLAIGCISLESIRLPKPNIEGGSSLGELDQESYSNLRDAFLGCAKLTNINLFTNWNMQRALFGCENLKSIEIVE